MKFLQRTAARIGAVLSKRLLTALLTLVLFPFFTASAESTLPPLTGGDPFILRHDGKYYLYATNHGDGIQVYESDDLREWRLCGNGRGGFALHRSDTSASRWFWAPEVYRAGKGFVMYFTRDERISCARAALPTGPFVEVGGGPMYDAPDNRIDNTLFVDDDGKAYVFFSRFRHRGGQGMEIWGAELDDARLRLREETCFFCLRSDRPWELISGRVTEGPFVLKHGGKYYLTYSANGYLSHDYAVGYAVADHPKGPYRKAAENPILRRPAGWVGSGHHSFFRDADGRLRIVFHVHASAEKIHERRVIIGTARFRGDQLEIGEEFIQPVVLPPESPGKR